MKSVLSTLKNNKISQSDLAFYISTGLIIIALKLFHQSAQLANMQWVLMPSVFLVELFINQPIQFEEGLGYVNREFSFVINKSCSGFNFMLIVFCLEVFGFIHFVKNLTTKLLTFFGFAFLAYGLTILINGIRISSNYMVHLYEHKFGATIGATLHEIQGGIIHLSALILLYWFLQSYFSKKYLNYEKTF
jgi:exosortase K